MPSSLRGAASFVFGFWLALYLLMPLVTARPPAAQLPATIEAATEH